ncbi:ABC transporter permease, partial [Salmonella enterica subsp. enterica serovar Hadar]
TFSSIGARLGICWAVIAEEDVSAAVADRGDNAKPKLRASALIANVVFFMCFNLD